MLLSLLRLWEVLLEALPAGRPASGPPRVPLSCRPQMLLMVSGGHSRLPNSRGSHSHPSSWLQLMPRPPPPRVPVGKILLQSAEKESTALRVSTSLSKPGFGPNSRWDLGKSHSSWGAPFPHLEKMKGEEELCFSYWGSQTSGQDP